MSDKSPPSIQTKLESILAEILRAAEAGRPLNEQALLIAHPDLASELKSFFANRAALEQLVEPMQGAAYEPTVGLPVSGKEHDGERVRYFGDYELLEELGRGGMGVVYKARQTTLNRFVALKMILSGQLASPDDVQRFKQEAEAAANLDHPHIAPIYETGEHQGQHYFSMKLIEGPSLREALPKLHHDMRTGVRLLSQVARAVHHAHQRGVLHRDLKPANVLLDHDQTPYVTDFGLAKRVEGGSDVTKTGAIVGTPSYMAPEQARAEKLLTTAVDVYSLGAILYELLTGQPPFRAESPLETLMQVASREAPRPRSVNTRVDRDLETIALKCLEKDSTRRYDSAAALADELDRWLRSELIVTRRASLSERLVKWTRRRPAVAALLATILVLIVTGQILFAWQWGQTLKAFTRAEGLRLLAQSEAVRPTDPGLALALGIEAAQRHPGLSANNALLAALVECREKHTLMGHFETVKYAEFSADGGKVLTRSDDKTVRLWETATGREIAVLRNGSDRVVSTAQVNDKQISVREYQQPDLLAARFSPDGRRAVTVSSHCNVLVWDAATGEQLLALQGPVRDPLKPYMAYGEGGGAAVAFSPDGKRVAVSFGDYGHPDDAVRLWSIETGKELASLQGHRAPVQHVQFSPDGRLLATASRDTTACLWDGLTGVLIHRLEGHRVGVSHVVFTPDSQRLVTTGDAREWKYPADVHGNISYTGSSDWQDRFGGIIWDVASGEQLASLDWPERSYGVIVPAAFSPDGRQLLTYFGGDYGGDGTIIGHPLLWDSLTGRRLFVLKHPAAEGNYLAGRFSDDGKRVALVQKLGRHLKDKDLLVCHWDAVTGKAADPAAPLNGHSDEIESVTFSSDGRHAVSASRDQTARIWDVSVATDFAGEKGFWSDISAARLTADGRCLLTAANRRGKDRHSLSLWELATRREIAALSAEKTDEDLVILDLSRDGLQALTGEYQGSSNGTILTGSISLWDLTTSRQRAVLGSTTDRFTTVLFSPDGKLVFTGGDKPTRSRFWDAGDTDPGKELGRLADRGVWSARFSPDGKQLLTTSRQLGSVVFDSGGKLDVADLWDVATGKLLRTLTDSTGQIHSDHDLAWSPDGRRVLIPCSGEKVARIVDATTNEILVEFDKHTQHITCGSYSPDGRLVATGSHDMTARIWNSSNGRELTILRGHDGPVRSVTFSTDGRRLLTTADDESARLWEVATGEQIATCNVGKHSLLSAEFCGNDQWILTICRSEARLWPVDPLSVAKARKPRNLTAEERQRFEVP